MKHLERKYSSFIFWQAKDTLINQYFLHEEQTYGVVDGVKQKETFMCTFDYKNFDKRNQCRHHVTGRIKGYELIHIFWK